MLAYGPRLVVLLPVLPLALGALVVRRQALLPLAAAAAIAVGPIMGGRVSLATLGRGLPAAPPPGAIRVLTFNARGGTALAFQLGDALRELQPDIALFQECDRILWDSLRTQPGLHVTRHRSLCTASRWPIGGTDTMPRLAFAQMAQLGAGGDGLVARHQLDTPGGPLYVVNLHLETARKGLRGFMGTDGFIPDGLEVPSSAESADEAAAREGRLARGERAMVREAESERAARWATGDDQSIPLIVAGDFNIPVESAIYRRHWSPYRNAFDETGTGLGWSKREGALLRIRIDHILVTRRSGLRPIGAVVGPDLGSDHLPILADIAWPGTR
jgi:endonuclease/exonuclease/phosphatase (EEP) superfamily protein YafD